MQNYMPLGMEFDSKVMKDVKDINKKIEEEAHKENPNNDELLKLKMARLYRGMELNSGYKGNNYRAMFPY